MAKRKNTVISCGPIPAKLDSVKFLTNMFKGGLAFTTAYRLVRESMMENSAIGRVTIVKWKNTPLSDDLRRLLDGHAGSGKEPLFDVVDVIDVYEYVDWYRNNAKNHDAFVMAAAVANLAPVNPYEGKFPSHNYSVGEEFDIKFCIAPRAIDVIKVENPRACLIGYKLFDADTDEGLIEIARHTLADSRANAIFANTPKTAKSRKLMLTQDGSVVPMSYDEHNDMIVRIISQEYFKTSVEPLSKEEENDQDIREAFAIVEMFEKTFDGYGTVAVPIEGYKYMFATTSRGHKGGPVLIRDINTETLTVNASGKATLNAPALWAALDDGSDSFSRVVVHRHFGDPMAKKPEEGMQSETLPIYVFPGTKEEYGLVKVATEIGSRNIEEPFHGYIRTIKIRDVDWEQYYATFPEKYFGTPDAMRGIIEGFKGKEVLEIGGNTAGAGKYNYDPYVKSQVGRNITWKDVMSMGFDLVYARNAVNYLTLDEIKKLLGRTRAFVANTFLVPPEKKVTDREAAVKVSENGSEFIQHYLRLDNDAVIKHRFFAYREDQYKNLGLTVVPYGKNSALVMRL